MAALKVSYAIHIRLIPPKDDELSAPGAPPLADMAGGAGAPFELACCAAVEFRRWCWKEFCGGVAEPLR